VKIEEVSQLARDIAIGLQATLDLLAPGPVRFALVIIAPKPDSGPGGVYLDISGNIIPAALPQVLREAAHQSEVQQEFLELQGRPVAPKGAAS